jgi:hypothetical protein
MKTQISPLVKGNHIDGVSGTPHNVRLAVAKQVIHENPEKMTISINGFQIELIADWSKSGKSVSYHSEIPVDIYQYFFGDHCLPKFNAKCFITIRGDMTVAMSTNSKLYNSGARFAYQYVPESEITIL